MPRHAREVEEQRKARRPLDQCANGRTTQAEDEIALPVPGHRAVVGLGRTLADQQLRRHEVLPGHARARAVHAQRTTDSVPRAAARRGASWVGGIPPACRNQRVPATHETCAATTASSGYRPRAIAAQNCTRSSRRPTGGRIGDRSRWRVLRADFRTPVFVIAHLDEGVLRRPIEFTSCDVGAGTAARHAIPHTLRLATRHHSLYRDLVQSPTAAFECRKDQSDRYENQRAA
jgi:hypothetical protein